MITKYNLDLYTEMAEAVKDKCDGWGIGNDCSAKAEWQACVNHALSHGCTPITVLLCGECRNRMWEQANRITELAVLPKKCHFCKTVVHSITEIVISEKPWA